MPPLPQQSTTVIDYSDTIPTTTSEPPCPAPTTVSSSPLTSPPSLASPTLSTLVDTATVPPQEFHYVMSAHCRPKHSSKQTKPAKVIASTYNSSQVSQSPTPSL